MNQVYDSDELDNVLMQSGRRLVVLALSSKRCGFCKLTTPYLESLSQQMPDVVFIKADLSESPDLLERFKCKGLPAFQFFRNNSTLYYFEGANTQFLGNKISELRMCN